ncbi:hypothetical protein FE257_002851 [Aspergillus nanangensis]|uniref:Uncharacterized protein n=1 Tax=Aspergillus nanangensis TaxID=2582783 RepID=A0AAD4CU87_ASPNN|nr:hypothetical protein FE257_002851 [Aspergillus nanangensis]
MDFFTDYTTFSAKDLYQECRWHEIRGKKFTVPLCNCSQRNTAGEPWHWHAHSRWKCATWKRPKLARDQPSYCDCDIGPGGNLFKYNGHWKDGECEMRMRRGSEQVLMMQERERPGLQEERRHTIF